ncbi:CHH-like protein isoform X1 [Tetranychus urticae]|uniref:Ion transport peptide n=2 Tax=Tetranychus urticae TaxID=32264 RepID=T1KAV5_TETUR|nr:CHH-like protein isoform X1 [Tetranychus urticae]
MMNFVAFKDQHTMSKLFVSISILILLIVSFIPLITMAWVPNGSPSLGPMRMDKKSDGFLEVGCYGDYDKAMFARLDRLCEECYELYRVPDLFTQCRQSCFRNDYFPKCIEALMVTNEKEKLMEMVDILNRGRLFHPA